MSIYDQIASITDGLDGSSGSEVVASGALSALILEHADNPERVEAILRIALSRAYRIGGVNVAENIAGNVQGVIKSVIAHRRMLNNLDETVYSRKTGEAVQDDN